MARTGQIIGQAMAGLAGLAGLEITALILYSFIHIDDNAQTLSLLCLRGIHNLVHTQVDRE